VGAIVEQFGGRTTSCEGKRRFGTETLALKWATRAEETRRRQCKGRIRVDAYRCGYCGAFHLTTRRA
jgi:hypothetical protein